MNLSEVQTGSQETTQSLPALTAEQKRIIIEECQRRGNGVFGSLLLSDVNGKNVGRIVDQLLPQDRFHVWLKKHDMIVDGLSFSQIEARMVEVVTVAVNEGFTSHSDQLPDGFTRRTHVFD